LLRRDKEKAELPPEIVTQNPGSTDWDDLLAGWLKGALALGVRVNEITNRKAKYLPPASRLWSALSDTMIRRAIGLFAAYETIVTDRLHGVILGALLGRNVIARDNSYGKVSSYVDCWLSDVPGISLEQ
jgi:pyruvyl transferase EpsO